MRIIIAGGGTGGHLYPGLAIGKKFIQLYPETKLLFIGTKKGLEAKIWPKQHFDFKFIIVSGFKKKISINNFIAIFKLFIGLIQSVIYINSFKPDCIIGVGGYASYPMLLIAKIMHIPSLIHEQNVLPGLTNKMLSKYVDIIAVSFKESLKYLKSYNKIVITGNPIREELIEASNYQTNIQKTILIFGGSQGAHNINMAIINALDNLLPLKNDWSFIHQVGEKDYEEVNKAYRKFGFNYQVKPYIDDMAEVYRIANLVICRAGASSIAEITAFGKAAILIPYPFAVHNHQLINAKVLEDKKAAIVIEDNKDLSNNLLNSILKLVASPHLLMDMADASKKLGHKDASDKIVSLVVTLIEGKEPQSTEL